MNKTVEYQILKKISSHSKGWAFSTIDFISLGSRTAVDTSLHRIQKRGTIRRVIRGIYDYPRYSELLKQDLSPDIDQVASALARKFGWYIQVTGSTALNYLDLSTQVPVLHVFSLSLPLINSDGAEIR